MVVPQKLRETADFLLRRSVFFPALLMLGAVVLLVNPAGNFPLNDDWAYAKQVHELLVNHRFQSSFYALGFFQTLWGSLFAAVFGESYTVLRLSTLALALVTLWATARCGLEVGLPRWAAIVCSGAVLANPIFLNLSYTFMTEIQFMAPLTLAGLFYLRALKAGKLSDLMLGGFFGLVAASNRQFGIIVGVAVAVTASVLWLFRRKSLDLRRIGIFLAPWAVAAALYLLLPQLSERPAAYSDPSRLTAKVIVQNTIFNADASLVYAGLFLLPLTLGRLAHLAARPRTWTLAQWVALPLAVGLVYICAIQWTPYGARYPRLPLFGNILHIGGTGPLTLRDTYLMGMPWPTVLDPRWWTLITGLSLASVGVFFSDVVVPLVKNLFARRGSDGPRQPAGDGAFLGDEIFLLMLGLGILVAPYHLVMGGNFDRYLLPAAPALAVLAARGLRAASFKAMPIVLGVLCLAVALPGVAAVHDYLAWNRARWQALNYLRTNLKVAPQFIDGGYEFNSVYTQEDVKKRYGTLSAASANWGGPNGFWVLNDTYAVSFSPRPGYRTLAPFNYYSWLARREKSMLMLRRL